MGLFSSRKVERLHGQGPAQDDEPSFAKSLKSRFYGKSRSTSSGSGAHEQPRRLSPAITPRQPSPMPTAGPKSLADDPIKAPERANTDGLTMNLAHKLNELAAANADGLLNDEEYRLLRQNLFERISGKVEQPKEQDVVPVTSLTHHVSSIVQRGDLHFQISRPATDGTSRSLQASVSSLLRRASGRSSSPGRPSPRNSLSATPMPVNRRLSTLNDASSFMSGSSLVSNSQPQSPKSTFFRRSMSRRPSDESLLSSAGTSLSHAGSRIPTDMRSIASRSQGLNTAPSIISRHTTRSQKPPSSFHLRNYASSPTIQQAEPLPRSHEDDEDDEDRIKSAKDLRIEIAAVEAEGRKLLDAFNGLELTALTRNRMGSSASRRYGGADAESIGRSSVYMHPEANITSSRTLVHDRAARQNGHRSSKYSEDVPPIAQPVRLKRKASLASSLAGSLKSSSTDPRGYFSLTSQSSPHLPSSEDGHPVPSKSLPSVPPKSVRKRPSIFKVKHSANNSTSNGNSSLSPPMTPSTSQHEHAPSRPSFTSQRSGGHSVYMAGLDVDAMDKELTDIRRRKANVSERYERRLDFLRAKLKAAEIRERLSKR